jgi:hypothetical protein
MKPSGSIAPSPRSRLNPLSGLALDPLLRGARPTRLRRSRGSPAPSADRPAGPTRFTAECDQAACGRLHPARFGLGPIRGPILHNWGKPTTPDLALEREKPTPYPLQRVVVPAVAASNPVAHPARIWLYAGRSGSDARPRRAGAGSMRGTSLLRHASSRSLAEGAKPVREQPAALESPTQRRSSVGRGWTRRRGLTPERPLGTFRVRPAEWVERALRREQSLPVMIDFTVWVAPRRARASARTRWCRASLPTPAGSTTPPSTSELRCR